MSDRIHHALEALLDPVGSRRREMLLEMEHGWGGEEQRQFCSVARRLEIGPRLDLCSALAAATTAPLIGLLGEYAASPDPALRTRAFEALENVPGPRRVLCLLGLLRQTDAAVLGPAIRLLGLSGDRSAGAKLLHVLGHQDPLVLTTTMVALRHLGCREAVPELLRLCDHRDTVVQLKSLETLVDLTADEPQALLPALHLITKGLEAGVRAKAAWVFGQRPAHQARTLLLQALAADSVDEVRAAAAKALGAYSDHEVVEILLLHCAHAAPALTLACRWALEALEPHTVFTVCRSLADHDDLGLRLEIVASLGALTLPDAGPFLAQRLNTEPEPVIRAALVEALGNGAWPGAWNIVLARINDAPVVAFAAVAALGNLLDLSRLEAFVALIDPAIGVPVRDAILTRLMLFARSRPLPEALGARLAPLLDERNGRGAELAAEILGHLDGNAALGSLLHALGSGSDRPAAMVEACCQAILRMIHHQLDELLEVAYPDHLVALPQVIARMKSLGENGPLACLRLAELIHSGRAEVLAALDVATGIEPTALVQAIRLSHDDRVVPLLNAWRQLSAPARERSPLDMQGLLRSKAAAVRASALDALDHDLGEPYLTQMVDLAIADPDNQVRQRARAAARRVVGC